MLDIIVNVVVFNFCLIFIEFCLFKVVVDGKIYIGKIDIDFVNFVNQIFVYIENEDGFYVQIVQLLIINLVGKIVYNG